MHRYFYIVAMRRELLGGQGAQDSSEPTTYPWREELGKDVHFMHSFVCQRDELQLMQAAAAKPVPVLNFGTLPYWIP